MRRQISPHIFTVQEFLSDSECRQLIARAENASFSEAPINSPRGPRVVSEARNNDRVMIDDEELAESLWTRIREHVPVMLDGRQARGLNERFRFYRYRQGQKFDWHADGAFERKNGERSFLTFMVYLNPGYEGGETRFENASVRGGRGMALVFAHGLIHTGAAVEAGTKYVLRSDVMFGPVGQFKA